MKKEKQVTPSRRQNIADWAKGVSFVMLFAACAACLLDVFVFTPGALTVSILGYIVVIGTGVALQFAAAAIPKMQFRWRSKSKNDSETKPINPESVTIVAAEPYRIDDDTV